MLFHDHILLIMRKSYKRTCGILLKEIIYIYPVILLLPLWGILIMSSVILSVFESLKIISAISVGYLLCVVCSSLFFRKLKVKVFNLIGACTSFFLYIFFANIIMYTLYKYKLYGLTSLQYSSIVPFIIVTVSIFFYCFLKEVWDLLRKYNE
jgi:hypothetical protein